MRHADLTDKGEPGFDLAEALCPKIEPGSMMSQRAVANFGNGLEESAPFISQLTVSATPLAVVGWRCKPESS